MNPFVYSEHKITSNTKLTIIDIEHLNGDMRVVLDDNFVSICEGRSGSPLATVKKLVATLYASKNDTWIMGATAEFFVHLYITLSGFKQECLHASHYDVGASDKIRRNIKSLSDDFTNGHYNSLEKFNTMPCGTVFLAGAWNPPLHKDVLTDIQAIADKFIGKQIHAICVTHKAINLFLDYLS